MINLSKLVKHLSENEKQLLKYGAIIVTIAISWVFIYKPITTSINSKIKKKIELKHQYEQMQSSQETLLEKVSDNKTFHRDINKPFISWIDDQLLSNKLSQFVTRSEPKDNQTLILTFESIVFDDLIQWLQPLEQNYEVKISEVDINLIDRENGICNARIMLEENK